MKFAALALPLGDADKGARKVKTFKQLQAETAKWCDYYNPEFSKLEVADWFCQ